MVSATAVIWIHALVALLFCGVVATYPRTQALSVPRWLMLTAVAASAAWALSTAGISSHDVATRAAGAARDLAWLAVLAVVARAADGGAARARLGVYAATAGCILLAAATAIAAELAPDAHTTALLESTALTLRMLGTVSALVLVQRASIEEGASGRQVVVAALALMWTTDLTIDLLAWIIEARPAVLTVARGAVMVAVAPLIAFAAHRGDEGTIRASRTITLRAIVAVCVGLYVVVSGIVMGYLGPLAGENARTVQTAFVFGSAASTLTLASTPWLRGWAKVVVAKHLFRHRYDYRTEWLRFTDTLGVPGGAAEALEVRVIKAMADMTASPAGVLLTVRDGALAARAAWRCDEAPDRAGSEALVDHLQTSRRIVDLDALRAEDSGDAEAGLIPAWLREWEAAWALIPLIHVDRLVGAIALARPPLARALDWEDFDLLGVAGRQVASYLAEDGAHGALAEAQRFEEFNRRFAFILHDMKNLVSQMALVARNAERHADNPAFRADMIATLQDTAQRMTTLLARLSQRPAGSAGSERGAVSLDELARRLATGRRAQHPVTVTATGDGATWALADRAALETVLGHLIQNAVEASPADVAVTLTVAQRGGEGIIAVTDRGAGMAPAFVRDGLFRPFVSSKPTGFGLGAFEARQLVQAMQGRLEVESREGVGTTFRVVLPRAEEMEEAA
ncbi:XrtA/PEP-CTERM system histidine kinase PrsK [Sphingomonas adhaesiva]|uniref:XrtA/PEP-CTERM system histidine kinase PrsK n=1 Tax=Sphingomonas adhaesiva TaxID=28212 RepID=UPI002FF6993C